MEVSTAIVRKRLIDPQLCQSSNSLYQKLTQPCLPLAMARNSLIFPKHCMFSALKNSDPNHLLFAMVAFKLAPFQLHHCSFFFDREQRRIFIGAPPSGRNPSFCYVYGSCHSLRLSPRYSTIYSLTFCVKVCFIIKLTFLSHFNRRHQVLKLATLSLQQTLLGVALFISQLLNLA